MLGLGLGISLSDRTPGGLALPPLPLHSRIVFEGDSITAGSSGPQFSIFALTRSKGRFFAPPGWNKGFGGETAAQMATQVAAVTALNPKVVVLLAGTNDLSGSADTAAAIFANIRTCVNAYKAAGARVISVCVLPRNDAVWDAAEETRRLALNTLIRGQTDVRVVDVESTFNPTTMCDDGLHPNWRGAIHLGHAVGDQLNNWIAGDVLTLYDQAGNFLVGSGDNPTFTGTTGTKTGTPVPTGNVPTGWIVEHNAAGGGLNVASSIITLNGRPAVRLQVSGTCDINGRVVNLRNAVAYNGVAGEFWEMWWDFSLASGAQNVRHITATTDTAMVPTPSSTTILYPNDVAVAGVLRPPMNTALAGADTSVTIQGVLTLNAGTVAADITWAAPCYRKVPGGQ